MPGRKTVLSVLLALAGVSAAYGSGPLRVYALIERVVFEGPEDAPEAIRVYGAFAFVEERIASNTAPLTGYLYFRLPPERAPNDYRILPDTRELTRNEWRDLEQVAGTGEAVAFGSYNYTGPFAPLGNATSWQQAGVQLYATGAGGMADNLTVRPESSPPADPAYYAPGIGVVRLGEGNHGTIVETLRNALK